MADQTKRIEVELAVKQQELDAGLKKATKAVKGLDGTSARMDKTKVKVEKDLLKVQKKRQDPRVQKKGIETAKQLKKLSQDHLKVIREQVKEVNKLNAGLEKARRQGGGGGGRGPNNRWNRQVGGRPTAGGVGGAASMIGGMGMAALAAAIGTAIGAVASQISQGYGAYSGYAKAQGGLIGTGATMSGMLGARQRGLGRGFGPGETMAQARQVAQATGNAGAVTTAQDLSRITGMDVGGAAGFMGQLTKGGSGFGGKAGRAGQKELQKSIALGFESGLDRARMPEFIQGVGQLVQMQGGRQGGDVRAGGFAQMLAAMGQTGKSGMQGERGANVLQRLNESMVKPGGGEAGQALMLQSYGFGRPGGNTSYYDALQRQEQGAQNPENIKALFAETQSQYGGGEEQILALRELTGLSITQLEGVREGIDNLDNAAIEKALKDAEPIDKQSLDQMKELGGHIKRIAELDERLVRIGEATKGPIESIQDSLNTMVMALIPVAEQTLSAIADVAKMLADSPLFSGPEKVKGGDIDSARAEYEKAQNAYFRGDMSHKKFQAAVRASSTTYGDMARRASMGGHEGLADSIRSDQKEVMGSFGIKDKVKHKGVFDILQGRGVGFKDPAYQKKLEQAQAQYQSAVATPGTGDDINLMKQFMSGGDFYELLSQVIATNLDTSGKLNKAAIEINKGAAKNSTPPAKASTGNN